jgi:hypothetical protein
MWGASSTLEYHRKSVGHYTGRAGASNVRTNVDGNLDVAAVQSNRNDISAAASSASN